MEAVWIAHIRIVKPVLSSFAIAEFVVEVEGWCAERGKSNVPYLSKCHCGTIVLVAWITVTRLAVVIQIVVDFVW